ncbi:MAG: acetyl-CoA carboxylase biotin carboxylase subunit [candidate division Zixibacteria bacterium]|nr:acetyl-CoA carboxylase biotin carboxylase subunit [candidate division Zixibacteria bacterium]
MKKVLVANRGEIAVRIIRGCADAGIKSVAIYSECDRTAYHVRLADEVYYVGPSPSNESYLVQNKIIEIAKKSKADAIHPGYGFLAENAEFAKLCEKSGIIFIGPKSETIALLGDKLEARQMAIKAKLPLVPGDEFDNSNISQVESIAEKIGYPVLIKAAAGGGGKGMRVVEEKAKLTESVESAIREATNAFGDGRVFIEKYVVKPRHVEIQIMADMYGNAIHLGERECSIQRRHQKVIEESPCPIMTPELLKRMGDAAVNIVKESKYVGAGTVEFLVDKDLNFYFLEVNTRLQVEHPITEMVTGIDIVREQFRIAEGKKLSIKQQDVKQNGHAIECRIYAEDSEQGFMPSTGTINQYREPSGPGVRVDAGVVAGSQIPIYYDPMIAKMAVWGADRNEAIERTLRALREYSISGLSTTIGFACAVMNNQNFRMGDYATDFVGKEFPEMKFSCQKEDVKQKAAISAAVFEYLESGKVSLNSTVEQKGGSAAKGGTTSKDGWSRYYRGRGVTRLGGGR